MTEDIDAPGLLQELEADSTLPHGCSTCAWLRDRDDLETWQAAFANPKITSAALLRAMRKRGYSHKDKPVQTHRKEQHRVA